MICLELQTTSPAFNLAFEEILCRSLPPNHPGYFLLWQNKPSVIIGRHQITQEVVNPNFVDKSMIPVIRRNSGGGAVYHDLGNLNFSFIQPCASGQLPEMGKFLIPICKALATLGITASINGRNDLEYRGKKFSGNSLFRIKNAIVHHGTLLVNLDLEKMGAALKVDESKFRSHGVSSMRSRVVNLGEITRVSLEEIRSTLALQCATRKVEPEEIQLEKARQLVKSKYGTWDWNYGKSPKCDLMKQKRFPWGNIIIKLGLNNGIITDCHIHGDFIGISEITEFEQMLLQTRFEPSSIVRALKNTQWERFFLGCNANAMAEFFSNGIFS